VKERIKFKILLFCFKFLHGLAPEYLQLPIDVSSRFLCWEKSLPQHALGRHNVTEASLYVNKLPAHIKGAESINSFKCQLKAWLFVRHFWGVAHWACQYSEKVLNINFYVMLCYVKVVLASRHIFIRSQELTNKWSDPFPYFSGEPTGRFSWRVR
jgi:hypothetical protein